MFRVLCLNFIHPTHSFSFNIYLVFVVETKMSKNSHAIILVHRTLEGQMNITQKILILYKYIQFPPGTLEIR